MTTMKTPVEKFLERLRAAHPTGTCPHCKTEQALDDQRLVMTHSFAPTRMICDGTGWSCVEDVEAARARGELTDEEPVEHCNDCGTQILGYHQCLGVPGGFPGEDP